MQTLLHRALGLARCGFIAGAMVCLLGLIPRAASGQTIRPCAPFDSATANLSRLGAYILSDTAAASRGFRSKFGIPVGTAADVTVVQDNAVCDAATAGAEAAGIPHQTDAYVTVRLGATTPFYLATLRSSLGYGTRFLFDANFALVAQFLP